MCGDRNKIGLMDLYVGEGFVSFTVYALLNRKPYVHLSKNSQYQFALVSALFQCSGQGARMHMLDDFSSLSAALERDKIANQTAGNASPIPRYRRLRLE